MIFDNLENLKLYTGVIPQLKDIISFIESGKMETEKGSYETDIKGVRYNVAEYISKDPEDAPEFEIHKKEIDLQIMLEGEEIIDGASRDAAIYAEDYNAEGDYSMVETIENNFIHLVKDMFVIYLTGEPHKPGLAVENPAAVKKIIFKIIA